MRLRQLVRADLTALATVEGYRFPSVSGWFRVLLHPGAWAVIMLRAANSLHRSGVRPASRVLYTVNMLITGCDCPPGSDVGPGLAMPRPQGTGFASGARIGADVRLYAGVRLGMGGLEDPAEDGTPDIGDGCWLLDGAKVLGPVKVGAGSVIGPNAWVSRDVPPDSRADGSPARIRPRVAAEDAGAATEPHR